MNFYEKSLCDFTDEEWEQICLKCGKCCMCKYRGDNVIHFSNHMCRFFDIKKGICSCYNDRIDTAKGECVKVDMDLLENHLEFLPPDCAYRRLYEGRGLPAYHPLLTGNPNSVIEAGQTVMSLPIVSENAREKALDTLLRNIVKYHWTRAKFTQKLAIINEKYSLKWLETYPLPSQ